MARYSTILTVFEQSETQLATIEQSIKPSTVLMRRIDNVFFIQMASNAKFWVVADSLEAKDLKFVYYFIKINERAEHAENGLEEEVSEDITTILTAE